ncbi:MAG TPA: hypothetical protein VJM50_05215 [Pyrinomonadaceae bacterium]|nr:hypothetical protein [Pyrinomonadaceae bacterium]
MWVVGVLLHLLAIFSDQSFSIDKEATLAVNLIPPLHVEVVPVFLQQLLQHRVLAITPCLVRQISIVDGCKFPKVFFYSGRRLAEVP